MKPDPKKGREADKQGMRLEAAKDWKGAFDAFSEAANWAPSNREYLMHRELARSRLVQWKMDLAEGAAVMGKLPEARRDLLEARYLDPTDTVVRERLEQLSALEPPQMKLLADEFDLGGEVQLQHLPGKRTISYRGTTQGAYQEVAKEFGVEVAFDVDLQPRQVHLQTNEDFATTLRLLGEMTRTFWRPLEKRLFFVAQDTAQKRKDYAVTVVRTVVLPASATQTQMTEIFRLIRDIAGITRAELDTRSRTITMRASPQAVAVATGVLEDLEQPVPELVLEIEVLEVDRTYAQQLGITPPQTSRVFTLNQQEVKQALASEQGLVQVIEQVFGTPTAFTGLTSSQVAGLLAAGQVGVGSLLPPLVAFGGGSTQFLATMPGASANLSQMLNLVRTGRRILLRAEDGAPATFFVGDRIPVTLAQFSPSLGSGAGNIPGVSSANFPETDLTTGNAPDFLATASLRNNGIQDLIAANKTDNTLSVFLSNGDGTFQAALTPPQPTGAAPVWIAKGIFNTTSGATNIDLAVANVADNTVSILLGNGDGTFTQANGSPIKTGHGPVSIAASNLTTTSTATGNNNVCLFVANQTDNTVSIFLGNGDGTFSPPVAPKPATLVTGLGPSSIVAADFNGDGNIDLAVTNVTANTVSVFLGNGDGTFGARTDYAVGSAPVFVATADFNGDGIPDLAVADSGAPATDSSGNAIPGNSVSILLGNPSTTNAAVGNGTFGAAQSFGAGTAPTSITVADFNIDGIPDLAVASSGDNAVSLLLGIGGGAFGPNLELTVGTDPVSIVSGSFNGENKPDAALANEGSNTVTVILNETTFEGTNTTNGLSGTPFPGVQYIDVGVKVKATPRVHDNDEVSLQLQLEISSLAGESFNSVPVIANQRVEQTVRIKENETAVVAGFRERDFNRALTGTPGLAEVPAVGVLDSNTNTMKADTELIFMITPRMMSLPPAHKEHLIYAGRGALEGPTGGAFPVSPAQRELNQQQQQLIEPLVQPPQAQPTVPEPVQPGQPVQPPNPLPGQPQQNPQ